MDRDGTNGRRGARASLDDGPTTQSGASAVAHAVPAAAPTGASWFVRATPRTPAASEVPGRKGLSPVALRAYLSGADVQDFIRSVVARRLGRRAPADLVEDLAQEANVAAMNARTPPRTLATARGWVAIVAVRTVINHFRDSAPDAEWLDREADVEALADIDVAPPGEPWLMAEWLGQAVAGDERDEETYAMLVYKAQTGKAHDDVATEHGITPGAWKARVHGFKVKYEPRWRRRRDRAVVLWLAGVALAAALAALAWWLTLPRLGPTVPAPTRAIAPVTPVTTAPDEPFTPAESARPAPAPALTGKPRVGGGGH